MPTPYTLEKIAAMTEGEIVALRSNAERLVAHPKLGDHSRDVLEWCAALIEERGLHQKSKRVRAERSSQDPVKIRENELAHALGEFARTLEKAFDLSRETAIRKSAGVKRFQPHKLTSNDGLAKLGGEQRRGACSMDRYISYRLGDDIFSLNAYLPKGQDAEATRFLVYAPRGMLPNGAAARDLRAEEPAKSSAAYAWGQAFSSLDDAKMVYADIISRVAEPRT